MTFLLLGGFLQKKKKKGGGKKGKKKKVTVCLKYNGYMVGYSAVLLCTDFFIPLFGSVMRNSFVHELNHNSVGPLKNVKNHL